MTLALSLDDKGACNACTLIKRGQILLFFVSDLEDSTMDTFGARILFAAAQGSRPMTPITPMVPSSPDWTRASGHPRTQSITTYRVRPAEVQSTVQTTVYAQTQQL